MLIKREWATPLTAGAFLLSAVTGILIFFHLDTGLNKPAHEWLGLVLVAGAAAHLTANFSAFKRHLTTRRGQVLVGVFVVILLASFMPVGGGDKPPFVAPIQAMAGTPLSTLAQVVKMSPEQLRDRLAKVGVQSTSDDQTLADLVGQDAKRQMHVLDDVLRDAK